jgi:hypothetical protein
LIPLQKPFSAEKPVQRTEQLAPVQAAAGDATPEPSKKILGYDAITWQKILPLGFMFFCILFNYTILRDTKVGGGRLAQHKRSGPASIRFSIDLSTMHDELTIVMLQGHAVYI